MSETPAALPIAPDGEPTSRRRVILLATLIFVVTVAAYLPAMRAGLLWDDHQLLIELPLMNAGDGLTRIWLSREAPDYWPLTYTMFWFEQRIWGAHPEPYHVANILLHAASAVVLWRVLRRLKVPGAFLAALVFGVHPVTAASVGWISERKNTLSMLLYLLTALTYLRFEDEGDRRLYKAAVFLFAAALLAKTSVVMLPFVLLLLAWWRRGRINRTDIRRAVPFFAVSLVLGLITVWFQYGHLLAGPVPPRPEGLLSRVAVAGWAVWFYLSKILLPARLAMIYPRWDVDGTNPVSFVPLILLGACVAVLWVYRNRWAKAPFAALGYFLLMVAPVLGLLSMTFAMHSLVADHLQYAPMIGVIALVAAGITRGVSRLTPRRAPHYVIAAVLVATLAGMTFRQARLYRDPEVFWTHTIELNDRAWAAYAQRGFVRLQRKQFGQALQDYTRVIELKPGHPIAYHDRGATYLQHGKFDRAIKDFSRAVELKPDYPRAHYSRGVTYLKAGEFGRAIEDFSQAIVLEPAAPQSYDARGFCHEKRGEFDKAARDFSDVIRMAPRYAHAYSNRARVYFQMKAYDKAWADVNACRRLGGAVDPALLEALRRASSRAGPR